MCMCVCVPVHVRVCVPVHVCVYSQDGGPVFWEVQQNRGFLGVGGVTRLLGV